MIHSGIQRRLMQEEDFFKKIIYFHSMHLYNDSWSYLYPVLSLRLPKHISHLSLNFLFLNNLVSPMNVVHIHIWAITLLLLQNKGDREDIYN